MRKHLSMLVAIVVCLPATAVHAFDLPVGVVDLHGRLESSVVVDERAPSFPGDHASRSPLALTRLMSSVEAGTDRYGRLYLKGVAAWSDYDAADGSVQFHLDQGDYLWRYDGSMPHAVRAFGNERRYFTRSLAPSLLDDDAVERFENHGGVRIDGARGDAWSWTALGGVLDDGSDDFRGLGFAMVRWQGAHVQGALSYVANEVAADSVGHHAAVKAEVTGFYRNATLVLSYENSGLDDSAVFLPDAAFDWDGYVGSNFAGSLPASAAAFGEIRIGGIAVRDLATVEAFHRYRAVGPGFVGGLSAAVPGTVTNTTGVFARHRTLALDGRVVYRKRVRWSFDDRAREHVEAQARAFLKNGSQVMLRGAVGHRDEPGDVRTNDNFVHAAVRRSLRKLDAGVHVMAVDFDDGEFERRFGVEVRMNWTANLSMYGRLISAADGVGSDAAYCRLEVRPTDHVFATIGYGRSHLGDGPYLIEDPDISGAGTIESVYTITVRGDF